MDALADFSLEMTNWLQSNLPQLESLAHVFASIGEFEFYLALLTLIYWCLEKRLGISLALALGLSYLLNGILKHSFRDPRPFWNLPEIKLGSEESYGIPSGHSQTATVFYGILALNFRKGWLWLFSGLIILFMLLSRIYLGVHDIEDVVAGGLLGVVILAGVLFWRRYISHNYHNRILGQRLFYALLVPLTLGAVYALIRIFQNEPIPSASIQSFVDQAEVISFQNVATAFGVLLGLVIGMVFERNHIRFLVSGPLWKRALRYLSGITVALAIWMGLGKVFPDNPDWLGIPLRILRYFLLSMWVSYYAPWMFVRTGLANAGPRPEITITS